MKATIDGRVIEGTPQEIADYLRVMDQFRRDGIHIKPPLGKPPEWVQKEIEETPKIRCRICKENVLQGPDEMRSGKCRSCYITEGTCVKCGGWVTDKHTRYHVPGLGAGHEICMKDVE